MRAPVWTLQDRDAVNERNGLFSPTMAPQYNSCMRAWHWFAASALWLCLVVAWTFDFHEGSFGGFGVTVATGKYMTPHVAFVLASILMYLILFGWVILLCAGLWSLTLRRTHR